MEIKKSITAHRYRMFGMEEESTVDVPQTVSLIVPS